MSQHRKNSRSSQSAATSKNHTVAIIVAIVVAVVLVLAAVVGFAAMQVFKQSKQVQQHEEQALSLMSDVTNTKDITALTEFSDKLPQVQQETSAANTIAHGMSWNIIAAMPFVGNNIKTVQGMTSVLNDLTNQSMPELLQVVDGLQHVQLTTPEGNVNLEPLISMQGKISNANQHVQEQVHAYNTLPVANIEKIQSAYQQGKTKLDTLGTTLNQLAGTFKLLPQLLGGNGQQRYAVLALTPSEMRSSGGLVGSIGEMTTDNGKISMGDFRPNKEYIPFGSVNVTPDEHRIFQTEWPLHFSMWVGDIATSPDAQRVAEATRDLWQRSSWGANAPLNGVIGVDPVFVQELVKINGDIHLPTGETLTGDNTAQFLLNTAYITYPTDQTDGIFGIVVEQCINDMFSNLDLSKLMSIGKMMSEMTQERHFSIYSFDKNTEKIITEAGFTATTPDSEEQPKFGVYLNEQNPSKMGWYVNRTSTVKRTNCAKDGTQTYHVEYKVENTLAQDQVASLPEYIVSAAKNGATEDEMMFYAPKGGSLSNFSVQSLQGGEASTPVEDTLNGQKMYRSLAKLQPQQGVIFSFDVTTSPKAKYDLSIDQTPRVTPGNGMTLDTTLCNIKQ